MLVRRFSIAVVASAVMAAAVVSAQTPAPSAGAGPAQVSAAVPDGGVPEFVRPETPEQRKLRLGTAEDPGPDPDPAKHFWRYGNSFHISKFERRLATYDSSDANFVRPLGMVNFSYELYQQNEKYVWCWMPDLDPVKVERGYAALGRLELQLAQTPFLVGNAFTLADIASHKRHNRASHWVGLFDRPDVFRASQTTASAISSGVPTRPMGCALIWACRAGSRKRLSVIGVWTIPGQTQLTRMPCCAYSNAAVLVSPTTPCLLAT